MARRSLIVVSVLALAGLLPATSASAAVTSEVNGGTLTVTGTSGRDTVYVACSSGWVKINAADPGNGQASCADLETIEIYVLDGNDVVVLTNVYTESFTSLTALLVDAGPGADDIVGSPFGDTLLGGPGLDWLSPRAGPNYVDGGSEEDRLDVSGTAGLTLTRRRLNDGGEVTRHVSIEVFNISTTVRGVRIDTTRYRGRVYLQAGDGPDRILLGGGNDFVNGGGGRDRIRGGGGLDYLVGGSGRDLIKGQSGNDELIGGPGRDRCYGGPGGDQFGSCEVAVE